MINRMRRLLLVASLASGSAQLPGDDGPCGTAAECHVIQSLFWEACGSEHKGTLRRNVTLTQKGYVARTTSANATIAALLKSHVASMQQRVHTKRPLNTWDPLYAAIFNHSQDIAISATNLTDGVEVAETGKTECATAITHAHAGVVTDFVKEAMMAMMTEHKVPPACPYSRGGVASRMPRPPGHAEFETRRRVTAR